jgi:hypothetical protein
MDNNMIEQFQSINRQDNLRKELEGKIDNMRKELDQKIESKLSEKWFIWVIGGLAVIVFGALGYFNFLINKTNDKLDGLTSRITTLETKITKK